jgi:hypothetical protein
MHLFEPVGEAPPVPALASSPLLPPVPLLPGGAQIPVAQFPLMHSVAAAQGEPSGKLPAPGGAHWPFSHTPLAQFAAAVHVAPVLPMHDPPWQALLRH